MKKIGVLLILLFILSNFLIISAQDGSSIIDTDNPLGTDINLDDIPETPEELKETSTDYLKKEWGKILENNTYLKPILTNYQKVSPILNPISKYTIGIEPSLTWLYLLTLILWIAFVIYLFRIFSIASIFSKTTQIIISFGGVIIISITGLTKKIAQGIINIISTLNIWWVQLIAIIIIITILILASIFSKHFEKIIKSLKDKEEKDKERINRAKLKNATEIAEAFTKELTE